MINVFVALATAGITFGRAQSLVGLAVGLRSVVVGMLAGARRDRALVALVLALIGIVFSGVRVATAGPIGSGSGRLGAIVALAVALIGAVLGGRALARANADTRS
jgi:hypothetical protein